jgi:hypothetical protein
MKGKPHKRSVVQTGELRPSQKSGHYGEVRVYSRSTELEVGREALSGPDDYRPAVERLLANAPSERDFVIHFVPSPRTLNKISMTPTERSFVISELEKCIIGELRQRLSPTEVALSRICTAMDEVIFQVAVEQGPAIFLVPVVLQRVSDWTIEGKDGARRWKRLGGCFAQFALVTQGVKTSLVPWKMSRNAIIKEVRKLRRVLHARFQERHALPANWVLLNAAEDAVEAGSETFPKLVEIKDRFQLFVNTQPEALRNLLAGHFTPADFTDQLIGWITNYKPGSVAQIIRRLR